MTPTDARKPVRVIAYNATDRAHETVNVLASAPVDPAKEIRECIQLTAAQAVPGVHPVVMAAPPTTKGLRTIFINGYVGPS